MLKMNRSSLGGFPPIRPSILLSAVAGTGGVGVVWVGEDLGGGIRRTDRKCSITYGLVGWGATGQLRRLRSSHGALEGTKAVVGADGGIIGVLEEGREGRGVRGKIRIRQVITLC